MDNVLVTVDALIERGYIFLRDKEWSKAEEYFNKALDCDPHNSEAYLGLCLVDYKCEFINQLSNLSVDYSTNKNYLKAYEFSDDKKKADLDDVYRSWQTNQNVLKEAKQQNAKKKRKKGIIAAAITFGVLVVGYFAVFPLILNILIFSGSISCSMANEWYSLTPYTFNYIFSDDIAASYNDFGETFNCFRYDKLNGVTIDTDQAVTLELSQSFGANFKTISNKSDCPSVDIYVRKVSNEDYDLFNHINISGFDDCVLFVEKTPIYPYISYSDLNGVSEEEYCRNNNISPEYYNYLYQFRNIANATELSITEPITDEDIQQISKMTNLTDISFDGAGITDFSFLNDMKNLRSLSVKNNLPQPAENSAYVYDFSCLNNMPELRELTLTNCYFAEIDIPSSMKNLVSLNLNDNMLLSVDISGLTNLCSIDLSGNMLRTFKADNCANITELNMDWDNINEMPDLSAIARLDSLNLSTFYGHMDYSRLPKEINTLFISFSEYSDLSLLATHCPEIEKLYVYYHTPLCTGLSGIENFENLKAVIVINAFILDNEQLRNEWNNYLSGLSRTQPSIELVGAGAHELDIITQILSSE